MDKKYKNGKLLERLYYKKGMNQKQIAKHIGCPVSTLSYWFKKHDIDTGNNSTTPAHHTFDQTTGYEKWRVRVFGERKTVMVHHLILVSEGEEPTKVFSDKYDTHHKNGHRFDNRPRNLELMEREEHGRMHANERWD